MRRPRSYNELTGVWATERGHQLIGLLPHVWHANALISAAVIPLAYFGKVSALCAWATVISLGLFYVSTQHLDERR
jgi:hypothetical protein